MSLIEKILLIAGCLAPVVALIIVFAPKLKKKKPKTFETTSYVPLEKEQISEPKEQPAQEKVKNQDELEDYREFLSKRKNSTSKPARVNRPENFLDVTESYSSVIRKNSDYSKQNATLDFANLPTDLKAALISDILDRKF